MIFFDQKGYLRIAMHFQKRCKGTIRSCSEQRSTRYASWELSPGLLSVRESCPAQGHNTPGGLAPFLGVGTSLHGHHSFKAGGTRGWLAEASAETASHSNFSLYPLTSIRWSSWEQPQEVSCMDVSNSESASQGSQLKKRVYSITWENGWLRNTWIKLT